MHLRFFLLGIIWLAGMLLLFVTPINQPEFVFNAIPSRSLVNFFLFWGFVHIWCGALKKQIKYDLLRRKTILIVFISALCIALIAEVIIYFTGIAPGIGLWNLLFDLAGTLVGVLTFRLLYRSCY